MSASDKPVATHSNGTTSPDLIGLIPAAGQAKRIAPLPCSKEIFPVNLERLDHKGTPRPKVVCHYLLEKMRVAGVRKAFIILREGKWDIPGYCRDGSFVNMDLAYLMMKTPFGPPYSLDQAYPFVNGGPIVVFGFPDIIFQPDDVFIHLLDKHKSKQSDVVLALFPAHNSREMDMVDVDEEGTVRGLYLKPTHTDLHYAWICAIWSRNFTEFLHRHLHSTSSRGMKATDESVVADLSVGHVLQAALVQGLHMQSVVFPQGSYIDIGTPEGLHAAMHMAFGVPRRASFD